jgi:hypothetical protein
MEVEPMNLPDDLIEAATIYGRRRDAIQALEQALAHRDSNGARVLYLAGELEQVGWYGLDEFLYAMDDDPVEAAEDRENPYLTPVFRLPVEQPEEK